MIRELWFDDPKTFSLYFQWYADERQVRGFKDQTSTKDMADKVMSFCHFRSIRILALLLGVLSTWSFPLLAQPYWLEKGTGLNNMEGMDIAVDAGGNTYTTGYYAGTAVFGSYTITASGITDIFITKVNDLGIVEWAVGAGGTGPDRGLAITTTAGGDVFVTGYFTGTATFGSITLTSHSASQDIFVAKYDNTGALLWAVSAGGPESDQGNSIALDNSANVFITGQFKDAAQFGTSTITSMTDPGNGLPSFDIFTTKYDNAGGFQWVKQGAAPYTDRGMDLSADDLGNVYVTGQFSDTITFDNTHPNNMFNAIFLVKYDANGAEQWFRRIGAATQNIAYGIATDNNSDIYLTGDFNGTLIFFGSTNQTLTSNYPENIFLAKYDDSGTYLWAEAQGSDSEVSARNIALDNSSNAYMVGYFQCRFSELSDHYGEGTFNSIGYRDVFVSTYDANGQWQWAHQCGGRTEDIGNGIALIASDDVIITGSYEDYIWFRGGQNFLNTTNYSLNTGWTTNNYCGESDYQESYGLSGNSTKDIFIAKGIDPALEPMDYYRRLGFTGCDRSFVGVCVDHNAQAGNCHLDSLFFCGPSIIYANTNTSSHTGPAFTYSWSTGATTNNLWITNTGDYSVMATTLDGCFSSSDTLHISIKPVPDEPPISDSKGVNNMALVTEKVELCLPDSVTLTGFPDPGNTYYWLGPGLPVTGIFDSSVTTSLSGFYTFVQTNPEGCTWSNLIVVEADSSLSLKMILLDSDNQLDTIGVCDSLPVTMLIFDTITNSAAKIILINNTVTTWQITGPAIWSPTMNNYISFIPQNSGWYQIDATLTGGCDNDSFNFSKSIYVELLPLPTVNITIAGQTLLCPGDTNLLYSSGSDNYNWAGGGIVSDPTNDSIWINMQGSYFVSSFQMDSSGCTATTIHSIDVNLIPSPQLSMDPANGVICPGDSVQLIGSNYSAGNFDWIGPNGSMGINDSSIHVNTPGFYYCVFTDTGGCELISNTVEVKQYATPFLTAIPGTVICPGDSVTLIAVATDTQAIQWLAPLSGSSTQQVITTAGTYSCDITSCGIVTRATINITNSIVSAQITPSGPLNFCQGDSVILQANSGMASYLWLPGSQNDSAIVIKQSGTYTLVTTDISGCADTSAPITVTVTPVVPPVVSDTTICMPASLSLTATASGTLTWYDAPSGGINLGTGSVYTTNILYFSTTFWIESSASGCPGYREPLTVTVERVDSIGSISSNEPLCPGDTLLLTADAVSGLSYSWTGPGGFIAVQANPYRAHISDADTGLYTVVLSGNECTGPPFHTRVTLFPPVPPPNIGTNSPVCLGDSLLLFADPVAGATYRWSGPGGFTDTSLRPVITPVTFADSGYYTLEVIPAHCSSSDSGISVDIKPLPTAPEAGSNSPVCPGDLLQLTAHSPVAEHYDWSGPDNFSSTDPTPILPPATNEMAGTYTVSILSWGCKSAGSEVQVVVGSFPVIDLGNDTTICDGEEIILTSDQAYMAYLWQDQSEYPEFIATQPGVYILQVWNEYDCPASDTVIISAGDCFEDLIIPTAFSPNQDGVNDRYFPVIMGQTELISFRIYNRWGEMIFETSDADFGWDGTYRGRPQEIGIYTFIIESQHSSGSKRIMEGNVTLLR